MHKLLNIDNVFYYVIFLMLMVGVTAMISFFELSGAIEVILKENMDSVVAAQNMNNALARISLRALIINRRQDWPLEKTGLTNLENDFMVALHKAQNNITLPGEGEIIKSVAAAYKDYIGLIQANFSARQTTNPDSGLLKKLDAGYYKISLGLEQLLQINHNGMMAASDQARQLARTRSVWMIFLTAIGFISAFYAHNFLHRTITRPITETNLILRGAILGRYDRKVPVYPGDLRELSLQLNELIDKLRSKNENIMNYSLYQRDLSSAMIEHFPAPAMVLDLRQQLTLCNSGARILLLSPGGRQILKDLADLVRNNKKDGHIVIEHKHYQIAIAPLANENLDECGVLATFASTGP